MERTYVNIPEETKLYASEVATRRKDITGEHGLLGFVEGDILKEGRVKVKIPLPCVEGADQEYETYFVNAEDLDIVEEDTEQVSPLTEEEEFEQSNLTEEEVEILHNNTIKHAKPIGGNYFDDEELSQDKVDEIENAYYELPTVRLKPGITYDYYGNRLGNLPNEYFLIEAPVNSKLATIRNKSNHAVFQVLGTNLMGY